MFLEAEVHSELRAFLREQQQQNWPHHLTMARLVARALRLGRSALIQTGTVVEKYCLSYLTPALLGSPSVLLVVPPALQQQLLEVAIPRLKEWLKTDKEVCLGDRWLNNFQGVMLTSPQSWLADRLENQGRFPDQITTLIDAAENLEEWAHDQLTASLIPSDWYEWLEHCPARAESIRDLRVQLTKSLFARPRNPDQCYLLDPPEQERLYALLQSLAQQDRLSSAAANFWQRWQTSGQILWAKADREAGQFTLHVSPALVADAMSQIWSRQPVVIVGGFLDRDADAAIYRQQLGLDELLCLKFSPNRQTEHIQLYLPERLPMPNTPEFREALIEQVRTLIYLSRQSQKRAVMLIDDVPLKAQVGAAMAAEFGSKVQVEKTNRQEDEVLICGWKFWRDRQEQLPVPHLLVIATLPLPSLENPLVAARVAHYKRQRQDWFRLYLLPTALITIQQAVIPLRETQGILALLDNRVNYRSYGSQILSVLEPYARINYLDRSWFNF